MTNSFYVNILTAKSWKSPKYIETTHDTFIEMTEKICQGDNIMIAVILIENIYLAALK